MSFKLVILWTDALIYLLVIVATIFIFWSARHEHLRAPWRQVWHRRLGMIALVFLMSYMVIGILDSIHYRVELPDSGDQTEAHYSGEVDSLLDRLLYPLGQQMEKSYSAPFATRLYSRETMTGKDGVQFQAYPRLKFAGTHLSDPSIERGKDIVQRLLIATLKAVLIFSLLWVGLTALLARSQKLPWRHQMKRIIKGETAFPWRLILTTLFVIIVGWCFTLGLAHEYHILGTDKVGIDVFYQALKSVRTGLVIGTLTTLVMLPFALLFGMAAGYFGGWIDDGIQYLYTTLSSIPGVLLIAAAILSLQVTIDNHPEWFNTLSDRADARLLALCVILGVTSWTGLCRLLRAETLKLRELDYISAAKSLGVRPLRIISRHVLPNVMHIVLITVVLDFSMLVLAEAVLSYVGVGVDPSSMSWGNMINSARLELAREPVVWWPLLAAFIFMFTLVLAANLFSDAVRDAFDPRIRKQS